MCGQRGEKVKCEVKVHFFCPNDPVAIVACVHIFKLLFGNERSFSRSSHVSPPARRKKVLSNTLNRRISAWDQSYTFTAATYNNKQGFRKQSRFYLKSTIYNLKKTLYGPGNCYNRYRNLSVSSTLNHGPPFLRQNACEVVNLYEVSNFEVLFIQIVVKCIRQSSGD